MKRIRLKRKLIAFLVLVLITGILPSSTLYANSVESNIGIVLYVAPEGTDDGDGSIEKPLDIYTAVEKVCKGQSVLLAGGEYLLDKPINIELGHNGTAENPICMIADIDAIDRPVFNFQGKCEGLIMGGDYWCFRGFDITNTADTKIGLQISGNYCTYDQINTYHNGGSGIQLTRLLPSMNFEEWPSYNCILNCSSYGNADSAYMTANGFSASFTVGDGNLFRGCMAYNNAVNGWDICCSAETGAIGSVWIDNSIAFRNGQLEDGTIAGSGDGFSLGDSDIPGSHILTNSIAFDNLGKGITSNSCPDIKIYDSTTFNNGSFNVELYSNNSNETDFIASGLLSFRKGVSEDISDLIKPIGNQENDFKYLITVDNYYWNSDSRKSLNNASSSVAEDWFVDLNTVEYIPTRAADGSILMNGVLEKNASGLSGAILSATPSASIATKKVAFDSNDGSAVTTKTVLYGVTMAKPANPSKTGYTFAGWYKESSCTNAWNFSKDKVTEDIILYAKWNKNSNSDNVIYIITNDDYNVTYDVDGGTPVAAHKVSYNKTIVKPADPLKTGYTFVGWYKESSYTNAWDFSKDTITKDTILYAKWDINSYRITYNVNGGKTNDTIKSASKQYTYNTNLCLPEKNPTRTGYNFKGWFTAKTGGKEVTTTTLISTSDVTYYAQWTVATPKKPTTFSVKKANVSTKKGITLTWKSAENATSYEIYRAETKDGKYKKIKTVKATSYTDKSTVSGKTYYYKIRSVNTRDSKTKTSSYTSVKSAKAR